MGDAVTAMAKLDVYDGKLNQSVYILGKGSGSDRGKYSCHAISFQSLDSFWPFPSALFFFSFVS